MNFLTTRAYIIKKRQLYNADSILEMAAFTRFAGSSFDIETIQDKLEKCTHYIKGSIVLGFSKDTGLPVIVNTVDPEIPADNCFNGFYDAGKLKDGLDINKKFKPLRERVMQLAKVPPREGEFSYRQTLVMETMAHNIRANACIEKDESTRKSMFEQAFMIYAGAIMSTDLMPAKSMTRDILKEPSFIEYSRVVDDALVLTPEIKRMCNHSYAGMAMCALFGEKPIFLFHMCMSASVSFGSRATVKLLHTVRVKLLMYMQNCIKINAFQHASTHGGFQLLYSDPRVILKYFDSENVQRMPAIYYNLTTNIILPAMAREGMTDMIEMERAVVDPQDWDKVMARAAMVNEHDRKRASGALPYQPGKSTVTHIVGDKLVERLCGKCGVAQAHGASLFRCSACMAIYYCSKDCQHADWKTHKPACKPASKPASNGGKA